MLVLELAPEIEARLDDLARRTGRNRNSFATEAIIEHLDDLEDVYLAEQRLSRTSAEAGETTPLAELMKRYGLED